jgi:formamidopyrimidine-DNA glycosylase
MPELPEVHTIINQIKDSVIGRKIYGIDIDPKGERMILPHSPKEFAKPILNQNILDVERHGKYIIYKLSSDYDIIAHLRMSGRFEISSNKSQNIHNRLWLNLGNTTLNFISIRRFSTFHLVKDRSKYFNKVGLDALDLRLNATYLFQKAKSRNINVYKFLMDQSIIAGLGNIYVAEVLFLSKISPVTAVNNLDRDHFTKMIKNVKDLLNAAIEFNGTTILSYYDANDQAGTFAQFLNVYNKAGIPCKSCRRLIRKTRISGRSVYYCKECQK